MTTNQITISPSINQQGRIYLGFDFGTRNIGVAVGQSITQTATPLKIIHARDGVPQWQEIAAIIKKWRPDALIVGLPLKMDDSEWGETITKKAQLFAAALRIHFHPLPVHLVDERLTTKAAREFIYDNFGYKALQKEPIDSFAAKIILESWMHEHT